MAVMKTGISWTDSTWNPTVGCTKVSAGCDHCYAEALVNRLMGGDFGTVRQYPGRIGHVAKFKPIVTAEGLRPRLVFVNSMSDLLHEQIPDAFRDRVFDAMEGAPHTVFQILTKRPMTLARYIGARYSLHGLPVPENLWLGVSVEDNRVAGRIHSLRNLKREVGGFTAFLSVEPLIGPVDRHDYSEIDWVIIGGESGGKARLMKLEWASQAHDEARRRGAAIWFKQFGTWASNPLYPYSSDISGHVNRVAAAVRRGEKAPHEKGGATFRGQLLHELPASYAQLTKKLRLL